MRSRSGGNGKNMIYKLEYNFGDCKISVDGNVWTISSWHVSEEFRNSGLGTRMLKSLVLEIIEKAGEPDEVRYIWNGQNAYVKKWLDRFDARCMVDVNVAKKCPDDDWESHMYVLNKELFLEYCSR